MESLSSQTFLITGAHGFIGVWITKRLLEANARVVLFDRSSDPQRLRLIMTADQISRAELVVGDITEAGSLSPVLDKYAVTNLIHLAGLQVPTCRADPPVGALVNVIGTLNVFEAVLQSGGQINNLVYASSAAVFGEAEDDRPMTENDEPVPNSHYGVFKRCNEGNARVYFLDHGINSIGLRPLTIYGVGRDVGLTSDPTKAMKAAVKDRPFHIRFGGRTDFQYVSDTADIFIRAATSNLDGAHVFNLHGETVHMQDVVLEIEKNNPASRGQITFAETPLPIPPEMNDAAIRAALGPQPATPLSDGVHATILRFRELEREGLLDPSDLEN